jgi:hypothetical protein
MMDVNATQLVGFLSFGVAAAFCYLAWRARRGVSSLWGWVTLVYILMTADTVLGTRYIISDAVRTVLKSSETYQDRRMWQAGIVICLLMLAGILLRLGFRSGRPQRKGTSSAVFLSLLAPLFFVLEATSLHSIDAFLYHPAGPVLLVGWIWMALTFLTAVQANGARMP